MCCIFPPHTRLTMGEESRLDLIVVRSFTTEEAMGVVVVVGVVYSPKKFFGFLPGFFRMGVTVVVASSL